MKATSIIVSVACLSATFPAMAGMDSLPPSVTSVPVDSPWVLSAMALALAVVGARMLGKRRK